MIPRQPAPREALVSKLLPPFSHAVDAHQAGWTVAAVLRQVCPDQSWSQVRRWVETRRVHVGGELCRDPARRLNQGDVVEVREHSAPPPRQQECIVIRFVDDHLVVVEKPSGIATTRHPAEMHWPRRRKLREPTLEDLVPPLLAEGRRQGGLPRLRKVHRLDKGTSGLLVFARTVEAERGLGRQFKAHTTERRYLAVVHGHPQEGQIASRLLRDRGDGRRGSTTLPHMGKHAVTHIAVLEQMVGHALVSCRLETGRTHQIRIHLAESGHPVCGDKVYRGPFGGEPIADVSSSPRLALHAAELGFVHPITGEAHRYAMPLPADLERLLQRLRTRTPHGNQMDRG